MDALQQEMLEEIALIARTGFYDEEEMLDTIEDMFAEEDIDGDWLVNAVKVAYDEAMANEQSWPEKTDFDKLAAAFETMYQHKVIALHNAGFEIADGLQDAWEIYDILMGSNIKSIGYCFYNSQDIDGAIDEHELYLCFGSFGGEAADAQAVNKVVMDALQAAGFQVEWNGSLDTKIVIKDINWQKRIADERGEYEYALEQLSK